MMMRMRNQRSRLALLLGTALGTLNVNAQVPEPPPGRAGEFPPPEGRPGRGGPGPGGVQEDTKLVKMRAAGMKDEQIAELMDTNPHAIRRRFAAIRQKILAD